MAILRDSETIHAAIAANDVVLMGRRTFEMGDPGSDVGAFEFQVPIFVAARRSPPPPPRQGERPRGTFVASGVAAALAQAKVAVGEKVVQVDGARA